MQNEKPEYLKGNEDLVAHATEVHWLIKNNPNLLPKSIDEIRSEIAKGLCFLALIDEKPVGYVAVIPYQEMKLTKISSYVVNFDERGNGIGTELVKQIYNLAKELYPEHKAITVVKLAVAGMFERLGMVRIDKRDVPKKFLDTTSIKLDINTPDKIILIES